VWQDGETSNPTGEKAAMPNVQQFCFHANAAKFACKSQKGMWILRSIPLNITGLNISY
jgi:hypothetical protein